MPNFQYFVVSLFCCLTLLRFFLLSELPVDSGDGLAHFFISQHVWQNPQELLNHWGKPLFTLLSAPWAYFGFKTYIFFNLFVYAASTLLAYFIFRYLGVNSVLVLLFPIALLTSLDYTNNILGGMTEVLFGFLALLSGWLLIQKHWVWFAVVVSFMPFSRSEGQLLIPIALLILIYFKQWKVLPFILSAFIIYGVIGYFVLDDFWWYFTQNPYTGAADIYGTGTWMHYVDYWYVHLGVMGFMLLAVCLPAFIWLSLTKNLSKDKVSIVLYFAVIYFGILWVHMYLWANGKNGALGLTRLAIHGWPGLMLACIVVLDQLLSKRTLKTSFAGFSIVFGIWMVFDFPLVHEQPFPRKAQPDERAVLDAAQFVQNLVENDEIQRVYYYHPLIAYKVGSNLKDKSGAYIQQNFANYEELFQELKPHDCIILDSHFGQRDMNFPTEKLHLFDEIAVFTPLNQYVHAGNPIAQVKVLMLGGQTLQKEGQQILIDSEIALHTDSLYTRLLDLAATTFRAETQQFSISSTTKKMSEDKIYLVIQSDQSGASMTLELEGVQHWSFSLKKSDANVFKIFLHNPHNNSGSTQIKIKLHN